MQHKKHSRIFYGYIIVAVSFIIIAASIGSNNSFGVYLGPVLNDFPWSRAATSGAYSLCLFLSGLLGIVAGRLNDKFGPRIPIMISGLLFAAGYFLLSRVSSLWQFYLYFGVLSGIAFAAGPVVPLLSTSTRWFKKRRSLMNGIITSGMGAGTLLISQFSSGWITQYGWRDSFTILGVICLVFVVIPALFLKPDPASMGQYPDGAAGPDSSDISFSRQGSFTFLRAVRTKHLWLVSAVYLLLGIGLFSILAHIVIYATGIGMSRESAVSLLVINSAGNIVSRIATGAIGDRIGNRKVLLLSIIVLSLAFLGLVAVKATWMLYLFVILVGITWGGISVVMSPLAADLYGLSSHGTIFGVINFAFCLGATIGPFTAGYIFDRTQSYNLDFQMLTALCFIALLATIIAWKLKPPRTN